MKKQILDGMVILDWIFKEIEWEAWTGLMWFNTGANVEHFQTR